MKTIEQASKEYATRRLIDADELSYIGEYQKAFKMGVGFAQNWISVDEKPDALKKDDEGIFYSEYLLIKVKGYEHPFVGFYVKANDDEFFDFIQDYIQEWINQEDIIGWRLIDIK